MEEPTKLWNRNFFLLWQGQLVNRVGVNIYGIAMALFLTNTYNSATMVGLMWMFSGLPIIVLGPIAGTVADRYSRRKLLIISDLVNGLALSVFTVFLFIMPEKSNLVIIALFVVAIILGITGAFFNPAVAASIPDIVPRSKLAAANSLGQISLQVSTFIGQSIGGTLFKLLGAPVACLLNCLTYIYALVSKIFIRIPQQIPEAKENLKEKVQDYKGDLIEGFKYVWNNKGLRMLISVAAITNFFGTPILPLLPFYVKDVLHVGEEWYGILSAATGIGALIGFALVGVLKFPPRVRGWVMMLFIILMAFGYGILGFIGQPVVALILSFIGGLMSGFISVNIALTLQLTTPSAIRGRVMALLTTLIGSLMPLGMGVGGYIGDLLNRNIPLIFASCSALMVLFTVLAVLSKDYRDFLSHEREIQVHSEKPGDLVAPDLA